MEKWIVIMVIALIGFFTIGQINKDNRVAECKVNGLVANRSADEINDSTKFVSKYEVR